MPVITVTVLLSAHAPHGGPPLTAGTVRLVSFAAAMLIAYSAAAEPYWVLLADTPGRIPGDPVPAGVVALIGATGGSIRTVSRYLNAVSVDFEGDPRALERLPGVAGIRPVRAMRRPHDIPADPYGAPKTTAGAGGHGLLADELGMLGVPALNDSGYTGRGVTIGVLESGFDAYRTTGCLAGVNVAAERNFVRGGGDVSGDSHGTWVLACIAGNIPNEYLGAAPEATFLLAVTEDPATETRADEDRWVAGVEWCDSLGADIISSSLVYNEFDDPEDNYTKGQMDGRTSLAALAAEIAVSRGITVVNAAGNEGALPWRIIDTPGDAEHVITVGAVTVTVGTPEIAPFSSRGPTADGRIKPDVVAPGVHVSVPVPGTSGTYYNVSGTSFSTPFIAGLCALLLEARPYWMPAMIMDALKKSSRDLGDPGPDNTYGWGLPDGLAALDETTYIAGEGSPEGSTDRRAVTLLTPYPNPFNPRVTVPFSLSETARLVIEVFSVTGARIAVISNATFPPGMHEAFWDASGRGAGVYFIRARMGGYAEVKRVVLLK